MKKIKDSPTLIIFIVGVIADKKKIKDAVKKMLNIQMFKRSTPYSGLMV
jgi:hypothetical protein